MTQTFRFNLQGGYHPGNSCFHRLEPRVKLQLLLLAVLGLVLSSSPIYLAVYLLLTLLLLPLAHLPLKLFWKPLWQLRYFALFLLILNAFFFEGDGPVLWQFGWLKLSWSGLRQGLHVMANLGLVLIWSQLLLLTTSPLQLTHGLSANFRLLQYLRLPAADIALILSVALQFVPILLQEAMDIRMAQLVRGAPLNSKKRSLRIRAAASMLLPLFLSAFQRAEELATALESRGFRKGLRAIPKPPPLDGRTHLIRLLVLALAVVTILVPPPVPGL